MFDPHRIGPISESYYSRNKGRVIQRKLVPPINPPLTKYDLDRAYEVLKNNGRIPNYTIQDTIVNYPGGSSTKRIAYEIGSTIKVIIPISFISISDIPGFIPLSQFTYITNLNQTIDPTHYYVIIQIEPNQPNSEYTEIYVNYLHQSSISSSGTYYHF
ncbi:uncharacterized protein GO595_003891 [Histomonas meleagridis]|uniref:uncharacterized protein n=1 Tax=Histomonas meleagridis TaxID=135588 RepID=UPI00355A5C9D|nr:hypothetical protein GO595_003891 [Histomonas meleagridis]